MADWKTELKRAYKKSANEQVKESDKAFDQAISNADRMALQRGMGRSSYTTQTLANLGEDKNEAGNKIRNDMHLAYLQALKEQERWQAEYDLQMAQFNWQKEQAAAAAAGGGGGGYGGGAGGNGGNGDTNAGGNWLDYLLNTGNMDAYNRWVRSYQFTPQTRNSVGGSYPDKNNRVVSLK